MNKTYAKQQVLDALKNNEISVEESLRLLKELTRDKSLQRIDVLAAPVGDHLLYRGVWKEKPAVTAAPTRRGKAMVIFHSEIGKTMARKLGELLGRDDVIEVELVDGGFRQDGQRFSIPHSASHFDDLFDQVGAIDTIYFVGGMLDEPKTGHTRGELETWTEKSLLSLFRLAKALGNPARNHGDLKLKVITNNVGTFSYRDCALPYAAPLIGFGQVVAKECLDIKTICIDVDLWRSADDPMGLDRIAKTIRDETGFDDSEVMYRGGKRYVRKIVPYVAPRNARQPAFRTEGVYIIVGAGGIGIELAAYLVNEYRARVVLVGRRSQAEFLAAVAAERRCGVYYLQGDITSIDSMRDVLAETKRRHSAINGIIHAAIVLNDGAITNLTERRFKDALAPKIRGTWVLGEVTEGERLDFIALFSSANSVFCSAGQSSYVAGCRFKDLYAQYLNDRRDYPVLTINWGYWGEVGVVADEKYRERLRRNGVHALTTAEGVNKLEHVLHLKEGQLIPIKLDEDGQRNLGISTDTATIFKPHISPDSSGATTKAVESLLEHPALDQDILGQVGSLNSYVKLYLVKIFAEQRVFAQRGDKRTSAQIKKSLNVIDKYDRLLEALLYFLAQDGAVQACDGGYVATGRWDALDLQHVDTELRRLKSALLVGNLVAHITLVDECLRNFLPILRGAKEAVHVIFHEGSMRLVEGFYKNNRLSDYCNEIVAKLAGRMVAEFAAAGRKVKVLEIGAGTGGSTEFILEEICRYADQLEYVYTDVSPSFLNHARREYLAKYPFITLKELNIEKPPVEQGFEEATYDIVVAGNVLHATRSLSATLENVHWLVKGRGKLVLNELTGLQAFTTVSFGLLDGWWAHSEDEQRLRLTPLMDPGGWEVALNKSGFSDVVAFGSDDRLQSGHSHHVLLSESGSTREVEADTLGRHLAEGDVGAHDCDGPQGKGVGSAGAGNTRILRAMSQDSSRRISPAVNVQSEGSRQHGDSAQYQRVVLAKPGRVQSVEVTAFAPQAPKPGEVQIRVYASALNFADLLSVQGLYPNMPDYPFTPGLEVSGVVEACGEAVAGLKPGQQVIAFGEMGFGGLSSFVNVHARNVIEKPQHLSHEEACAFSVVFVTVHHALQKAKLRRGEKILIQTAAGGTGLIALQMAQEIGAEIFATAGSDEKLSYLRAHGATHTINYRTEDFAQTIRTMTGGYGVDVVLNTLSGDAIQKGIDLLAPNGRYVEIAMAGIRQAPALDLRRLTDNQVIIGVDLARLLKTMPDLVRTYLEEMARRLREGNIRPTVGRIFPLSAAQDAFRCLEQRQNIGKVVIRMPVEETGSETGGEIIGQVQDIAVVGMAGRFPQASNVDEFFENLQRGTICITEPPSSRWSFGKFYNPDQHAKGTSYSKLGGFLPEIDTFDPTFFNISGREAEMMDPQQRLFLEEAWKAIEDAGFADVDLADRKFGVFVGTTGGDYQLALHERGHYDNGYSFTGNSPAILAGRISYFLNLKGPCFAIDTACSSSLIAIHQACQSLRSRESDVALAGGVYLMCSPKLHVLTSQIGMLSPTGACNTFDKRADGFVPGEAVVAVVLKPYQKAVADGDRIYAIIKGSKINQDGETNGITSPSAMSQLRLLRDTYQEAGIRPDSVGYVEAHGTGTKMGDPIEVTALVKALDVAKNGKKRIGLGSVKANIGHAATAAGAAGFVKAVLSVKEGMLFPQTNYTEINDEIEIDDTCFFVNTSLRQWPEVAALPRRAGVSSFGFSGTNCHMIVQQAPPQKRCSQRDYALHLATVSAKSEQALVNRMAELRHWLAAGPADRSLFDICYNLNRCRTHFCYRAAFIIRSIDEFVAVLGQLMAHGLTGHPYVNRNPQFAGTGAEPKTAVTLAALERFSDELELRGGLDALAHSYIRGAVINWSEFYRNRLGNKLALPAYPFERGRYWMQAAQTAAVPVADAAAVAGDWLATFEFERPAAPMPSVAEPLAGADPRAWAIEIINDEAINEFAVLFSTVDDPNHPTKLVCEIGFANGSKSCSVWRDRGFPLVDAIIKVDRGDLTVCAACFLEPPEMNYEANLISIKNIVPLDDAGSFAELATLYEQKLLVPDSAFPATQTDKKTVTWSPKRIGMKELKQTPSHFKGASRWPSLAPFKDGDRKPTKIWSGIVVLPKWPPEFPRVPVERASRLPIFGEAEFRFEDVEVLGFRIDLTKCGTGDDKRLDDDLAELVKPLNFHLDPLTDRNSRSTRSAVSDFRYRPASRMLALELLRYGKMKLKKPSLPFTLDDFQSQHELLVRILVGRVDDDTAQAHDAATFVPAIFVDNPWSKVLGRAVQGFDKRMADFCVKDVMDNEKLKPLRPDGRLLPDDKKLQPLMSIAQIRLAAKTGEEPSKHVLIDLDCPSPNADDKDVFDEIDLNLVFGTFPFPPMRWRQTDFDKVEFRRSFARSVVAQTLKGLRSIQVSPIGERKLQQELRADTTWIKGAFTYDNDMRVARPNGTVCLTFHAEKYAPLAWKALCKLLGINEARKGSISLPTGSWYRVRCSMDLKIDNGLD